eukprot:2658876-Ditylum_brightwellii.AAC.1
MTLKRHVDMIVDNAILGRTNTFGMDLDLLMAQINHDISIWGEYLEGTDYGNSNCWDTNNQKGTQIPS